MLVVPVYNMLLTPDATVFFQMEQLRRSAGGRGISAGEKVYLIVAKENQDFDKLNEDSFYLIGVAGVITEINQQGYAQIRTQYRVEIESVGMNPDRTFQLTVSRRNDIDDLDREVEAEKLKNLLQEMKDFASGFRLSDLLRFAGSLTFPRSSPFRYICPESGVSRKFMHRSSVVLPEPEDPRMESTSPLLRVKSIPLRTSVLPKLFLRSVTFSISISLTP